MADMHVFRFAGGAHVLTGWLRDGAEKSVAPQANFQAHAEHASQQTTHHKLSTPLKKIVSQVRSGRCRAHTSSLQSAGRSQSSPTCRWVAADL